MHSLRSTNWRQVGSISVSGPALPAGGRWVSGRSSSTELEEYVRVVMALLRGETVEAEIERKKRLIRLLNPELGLINTRDPIPLWVAASGPRARALTAKLGAGWDRHDRRRRGCSRGDGRHAGTLASRRTRSRADRERGADRR